MVTADAGLDEARLFRLVADRAEHGAAEVVLAAVAGGVPVKNVAAALTRASVPHLDLCAALPFPARTLDAVFAAVRATPRLPKRLAALVLARAAASLAQAPHPRRRPPEVASPGITPEDPASSLGGAIGRGDLALARGLHRQVLAGEKGLAELGRALVDGTYGDAFQGGEKMLVAIAAWSLAKGLPPEVTTDLVDRVLPYLVSEPRDTTPRRVFEALERGEAMPPLEPGGLEPAWLMGLARGLAQSQLRVSLPRLLEPRVLRTLAGRVHLPEVASARHVAYAEGLVARSVSNLPENLRPLHRALREGDRETALPMTYRVLDEGRGYGRVLRLAALVGAERMLVRRYRWGFGMAQDMRLCHASAVMADGLGVRLAVPSVLLTAWVVGRGGASVAGGLAPTPAPSAPSLPEKERGPWLEALEKALRMGALEPSWEALSALMAGMTPISRVNRSLLEAAALRADPGALVLSYTLACVEVAEHMPRLDAELVLGAALCHLLLSGARPDPPWLLDLLQTHLPEPA